MNPLLTKQPRCRCATAAYVRRSRHPGKIVLARVHRRRNSTAVKRNASERPILKQTPIPNDLFFSQPWTARRVFAPFQNAIPAALKGGHFFAFRVVPCRPGRLRGTCRRVQLRAQWTVGERFGRFCLSVCHRFRQTTGAFYVWERMNTNRHEQSPIPLSHGKYRVTLRRFQPDRQYCRRLGTQPRRDTGLETETG